MKIAMLVLLLVIDIAFASVPPPMSCRDELAAIEAEVALIAAKHNGMPPVGTVKPRCLEDGTYAPRQCRGSVCRCVSAQGTRITEDFSIGLAYQSDCSCARDEHDYSLLQIMGKMFFCTPIGSYHPIQCTGSVCYCVDKKGQQIGQETAHIGSQDSLKC
ncbi:equistatin-like [Mizuhopecten yessoensis]|uniref:Thyroglobulin n=1 Tax=Mizuhopecten yessoensis TaxID=6573 RepID=A0A210PY59_MIZYE|nr:equistatin-like [Mizuhopecten yessoensis]OWF41430.1 Thyroglobulin [Mizuhopecten yessoensis]